MAPGITASFESSARLSMSRASIGRTNDSALKPKKAEGTERCDPTNVAVALLGVGTAATERPTDTPQLMTATTAANSTDAAGPIRWRRRRPIWSLLSVTSKCPAVVVWRDSCR